MRTLLALALLLLLTAPSCGGSQPLVVLRLEPETQQVPLGGYFFVVVTAYSGSPLQAYDLALEWDPADLEAALVVPHADFDDDSALFLTPVIDLGAGRVSPVVDLRHGAPVTATTSSGTSTVLVWFQAVAVGSSQVHVVDASVAGPGGALYGISSVSATVNVVP